MPSVVCPIPTAHDYASVKAAYDQAKKSMPGLTPAAWRKAAAQSLAMDYNSFLAIWKTKGKVPLVAESTPTLPAAAAPGPTMGIGKTAIPDSAFPVGKPSTVKITKALSDKYPTLKGQKTWSGDGYYVKVPSNMDANDVVKWLDSKGFTTSISSSDSIFIYKKAIKKGVTGTATEKQVATQAVKAAEQAAKADEVMTHLGPLNNALAKQAYHKMKADMPGATPATLRKAAADYLGVDYNTYLKAWKAKGTTKVTAAKLPPNPNVPVSPSTVGKYESAESIKMEDLKEELARLYGPGANKDYINLELTYDGVYKVQFPNSLLPTAASKNAVKKGLEKLGLKVEKHGSHYTISTKHAEKLAAQNAKQVKKFGTYTLSDGRIVLDMNSAKTWSNHWWKSVPYKAKSAWHNYTGSGYREINRYWRKGVAGTGSQGTATAIRATSKLISDTMETVTTEFTVFRGTNLPAGKFPVKGKLWTDDGFLSTSINPGGAWTGTKFEIVMTPGSRGMYIGPNSLHPGELEFLIERGTTFRVLEANQETNTVKLVAIPKKKVK